MNDPRSIQLLWQLPLFILSQISAALQGIWRYWTRGSVGARRAITCLLVASVGCFVTGLVQPSSRPWSMLGAVVLGPVPVVFHMIWTWLEYEGPPQTFQPLPRVLERIDAVVTWLGEKSNLGVEGLGTIAQRDPDESLSYYYAAIAVEDDSPVLAGGRLGESVGLETAGGVFTPLLPAGCEIPCEITEGFSTLEDNQDEIRISLYRGSSPRVIGNHFLGEFTIGGIPRMVRGVPLISVTLRASLRVISLTARGPLGIQLTIERRA